MFSLILFFNSAINFSSLSKVIIFKISISVSIISKISSKNFIPLSAWNLLTNSITSSSFIFGLNNLNLSITAFLSLSLLVIYAPLVVINWIHNPASFNISNTIFTLCLFIYTFSITLPFISLYSAPLLNIHSHFKLHSSKYGFTVS